MPDKKIVVVTGATRGLGREAALGLAMYGHHIIALGRTVGALEELDDEIQSAGGSATLVPADFAGDLSICDALGAQLYERFGKVDTLIMAAAILGPLTPLAHLEPSQAEKIMKVNYQANARLIRSMDGLLRQSEAAKAVFVTCSLGDDSVAYWGNYRASKAAFATLADSYAAEVRETPISVIKFDPGPMQTRLHHDAYPGAPENSVPLAANAAVSLLKLIA